MRDWRDPANEILNQFSEFGNYLGIGAARVRRWRASFSPCARSLVT